MRSAGVVVCEDLVGSLADLAARLRTVHRPVLIMRSGSWLMGDPSPSAQNAWQRTDWASSSLSIPRSATGRPLVAFGSERPWLNDAGNARSQFARILRRTGGDFARMPWWSRIFPEPGSIFLEPLAAHELGRRLASGASLAMAAKALARDSRFRAVRVAALDFHEDAQLRVVQLVTTIQIGGAERVALDLADELNRRGHVTVVAALGNSARLSFSEPRLFFDLSHVPYDAEHRAEAVAALAIRFGADVIHAHLISGGEAAAIKRRGLPLVMTVHNVCESWPRGLATGDRRTSDLILACSKAVERSLENAELDLPLRTVWNGIDPRFFAPSKELETAGLKLREQLGWSPSTLSSWRWQIRVVKSDSIASRRLCTLSRGFCRDAGCDCSWPARRRFPPRMPKARFARCGNKSTAGWSRTRCIGVARGATYDRCFMPRISSYRSALLKG